MGAPLTSEDAFRLRFGFHGHYLRPALQCHSSGPVPQSPQTPPARALGHREERGNSERPCRPASATHRQKRPLSASGVARPRSACWQALPARCRPLSARREVVVVPVQKDGCFHFSGAIVDEAGKDKDLSAENKHVRPRSADILPLSRRKPGQRPLSACSAPSRPVQPACQRPRSAPSPASGHRSRPSAEVLHSTVSASAGSPSMKELSVDWVFPPYEQDATDCEKDSVPPHENDTGGCGENDSSFAKSLETQGCAENKNDSSCPTPHQSPVTPEAEQVRKKCAAEAANVWKQIAEARARHFNKMTHRWAVALQVPGDPAPAVPMTPSSDMPEVKATPLHGRRGGCPACQPQMAAGREDEQAAFDAQEKEKRFRHEASMHRLPRPQSASNHHAMDEGAHTPGPGHYEHLEVAVQQGALILQGSHLQENTLADAHVDGGNVGPARYHPKDIMRSQGAPFAKAVPTHAFEIAQRWSGSVDAAAAYEQAISMGRPSTPVARLDQKANGPRLADFHSATWRLGGNLISTAPAGPSNSRTEHNCWRHQRPDAFRKQPVKQAHQHLDTWHAIAHVNRMTQSRKAPGKPGG